METRVPARRGGVRDVAGTAAEQAGEVTREARRQAGDLLGEARDQATEQVRAGRQSAAGGLRALAGELHGMADGADRRGPASDLVEQVAARADDLTVWLDRHEPGAVVAEVRAFAAAVPGPCCSERRRQACPGYGDGADPGGRR